MKLVELLVGKHVAAGAGTASAMWTPTSAR